MFSLFWAKKKYKFVFRSAPASPSHVGMSGLMTPERLSREGSPTIDTSANSPGVTSQSAPGSPRHKQEGIWFFFFKYVQLISFHSSEIGE